VRTDAQIHAMAQVGAQLWGRATMLAGPDLRALAHAGASLLVAVDTADPSSPPVGFAIGFLGWAGGVHLHSHQVGVLPGRWRGGIGYALKLAQRADCLAHGISSMRWTFDPLILRNAHFNVRALGAQVAGFHPDFYGRMGDAINGDDATDRLEADWALDAPLPAPPRQAADTPGTGPALLIDSDGWPRLTGLPPQPGQRLAVPADYERLRREDTDRAQAWRDTSRQALHEACAAGLHIVDVDAGGYLLGQTS
jgi:predicted GNAT superfamily acetyltransferase